MIVVKICLLDDWCRILPGLIPVVKHCRLDDSGQTPPGLARPQRLSRTAAEPGAIAGAGGGGGGEGGLDDEQGEAGGGEDEVDGATRCAARVQLVHDAALRSWPRKVIGEAAVVGGVSSGVDEWIRWKQQRENGCLLIGSRISRHARFTRKAKRQENSKKTIAM